ncbi:50S ribosomal protein L22 [Candidatus Parvarchaeota archaeon]|nr:50S ribosomal protein L22 [Candidatus Parvarchaeota archaeon]
MPYAFKFKEGKTYAKAQMHDVNVSYKDMIQVCGAIRYKTVEKALEHLDNVLEGTEAILYKKFNKGLGHRSQLGGRKGGFPVKAVEKAIEIVENVAANARKAGFENGKIVHVCANRQSVIPRMSPKGRQIRQSYQTARIEIVIEQVGGQGAKKPQATQAAGAAQAGEKKPEALKAAKAEKKAEGAQAVAPKAKEAIKPSQAAAGKEQAAARKE